MTFLKKNKQEKLVVPSSPHFSLATGSYNDVHVSSLHESPRSKKTGNSDSSADAKQEVLFLKASSSFLRVADLGMPMDSSLHSEEVSIPHFHHMSSELPPGIVTEDDKKKAPSELWIALDDGQQQYSPMAPIAIEALAKTGRQSTFDPHMWKTADSITHQYSKKTSGCWYSHTWEDEGKSSVGADMILDPTVLVWTGNFTHECYGHELPAVRAAGFIPEQTPQQLVELLMDSTRVHEYNKVSLGRDDLFVLQDNMNRDGIFGGMTKVCTSQSQPPLLRKPLEFTSILHARERPDGSYKIVSRAVHQDITSTKHTKKHTSVLKSEILLGVTILKPVDEIHTLMITVNHIRSPMVPLMIAKRIGISAATNFFHDIRKISQKS